MKSKTTKTAFSRLSLILLVSSMILFAGCKENVAFTTATISEGMVETTVMATGYVQPVEKVEVGTQVSGVIEKIYVDYNSPVKKGQLLAQLETNTLSEKVNQAKASLRASQSELNYATQNYERVNTLYKVGAATQIAYEEAVNKRNQAETTTENAKATLKQMELDLSYAYIYSPIDGVILDRAVNTGQTVAAMFATPTLFTIAKDLTKMQVEAEVDEADIGQLHIGQQVTFTVDAHPDDTFIGTVSQIRLQPAVTANVVTYTVIVEAPNPDEKLFPGMTANITIIVASERGLLVPVEAVNFQMDEEIAANLEITGVATDRNRGVWIKSGDHIEHRQIGTGLGDGIFFIVKSGLSNGEEVVLSATIGEKSQRKKTSLLPEPPKGASSDPNRAM